MPNPQICENDWIQCLAFLSRPQLLRLTFVHRIFHQLIQQYFPERPYAPAQLAIWADPSNGQLWAGILILEWAKPYLAKFQNCKKMFKITKWLGIRPFVDDNLNEDMTAMEKCNRIVEIFEYGAHADCPAEEWELDQEYGYKYSNIEVAKFVHDVHLKGDEQILLDIKKKNYGKYNWTEDGPRNVVQPIRLIAKTPLSNNANDAAIANFLAHLDAPFIRIQCFTILRKTAYSEEMSEANGCAEENKISENNEYKEELQRHQLFNFLDQLFTPTAYKNTKIASIFAGTEIEIKMNEFTKIFLKYSNNQQKTADLLKRMAICFQHLTLFEFMGCHLQADFFSQWNALIHNVNDEISICHSLAVKRYNNNNNNGIEMWLREELLPILYGYNPQENPDRVLNIRSFCDYWQNILTILIEDFLFGNNTFANTSSLAAINVSSVPITYQCKIKIFDESFYYRWIWAFERINTFMAKWQQYFHKQYQQSLEQECMERIMFSGFPSSFTSDFILSKNVDQTNYSSLAQYYWRLILVPSSTGCKIQFFCYRTSETAFHANLCENAQLIAKWWQRCVQLYWDQNGMEAQIWPGSIRNCNYAIRTTEDVEEIEKSWTNYILAKWMTKWRHLHCNE